MTPPYLFVCDGQSCNTQPQRSEFSQLLVAFVFTTSVWLMSCSYHPWAITSFLSYQLQCYVYDGWRWNLKWRTLFISKLPVIDPSGVFVCFLHQWPQSELIQDFGRSASLPSSGCFLGWSTYRALNKLSCLLAGTTPCHAKDTGPFCQCPGVSPLV